ncbi:MAG: hypothetical protein ATN31_09965 [Candidatus Epulonipiscioides saccharophilum]|nr:MAG: hypothetical protein ATN31_09965 [Epulopiscium sp. AS2M-Bin001]
MKTLFKHEFRILFKILMIFIAFAVGAGILMLNVNRRFLINCDIGILEEPNLHYHFYEILKNIQFVIVIPIMIMVYCQFREVKDANVSEFILSLPFSAKKISIVKIISGLTILLINGVIVAFIFIGINTAVEPQLMRVRAILPVGESLTEHYTNFTIFSLVVKYTMDMIFMYLMFVLGQFLVKKVSHAIILTLMGIIAIPYIIYPFVILYGSIVSTKINELIKITCLKIQPLMVTANDIDGSVYKQKIYSYNIGQADIILVAICVIVLILIIFLVKEVGFVRFKNFTCSEILDKVLIAVAGICSGFIPFYYVFVFGGRLGVYSIIIFGIVTGILGSIAMSKIIERNVEAES